MKRSILIGVRPWAFICGLLAVTLVSIGTFLALRPTPPPAAPSVPPAQAPCHDEADLRNVASSRFACTHHDARIEVYPAGAEMILVKCLCPRTLAQPPASPERLIRPGLCR